MAAADWYWTSVPLALALALALWPGAEVSDSSLLKSSMNWSKSKSSSSKQVVNRYSMPMSNGSYSLVRAIIQSEAGCLGYGILDRDWSVLLANSISCLAI